MREALKTRHNVEPALRKFEQEAALVIGTSADGGWAVRSRSGEMRADRAASCLVEPRSGDMVLIAASEGAEEAYVLAILRRAESDAPTTLLVENELSVKAARIELAAEEGIRIVTPNDLSAAAHTMHFDAKKAKFFVETMAYLGHEVVARVKGVKVAGRVLDGAWETVTQTAKRLYRTTTETEQVRAQNRDVRVDQLMSMHADNAGITAKQLIKMDAGQIVMG